MASDGKGEVPDGAREGVDDVTNPSQRTETGDEDAGEQDAKGGKERYQGHTKRRRGARRGNGEKAERGRGDADEGENAEPRDVCPGSVIHAKG